MRLKRKVVKSVSAPDKFLLCERFSQYTFETFSEKFHKWTNRQIRNIYKEVFGHEPSCDIVWAKYQIQYELARQSDIRKGLLERLIKGSAFRSAYEGTMRCDLSSTGEMLKTIIPLEQKYYQKNLKENLMKKEAKVAAIKKAAEVKKSKCVGITLGLSVYDTWVHVFKKNATTHATDDKITEFLLSEFPDHQIKSFYAVHACRGYYNQGRFTKGVKPEVKSVRYNEAGEPMVRGSVKPAPVAKKAAPSANTANKAAVKTKAVVKKRVSVKKAAK